MATLLEAVDSREMQADVTFEVDHFVSVVLLGKLVEGGLDNAHLQTKDQVQGGLFLDLTQSERV